MDIEEGTFAVKAARKSIESETLGLSPEIDFPKSFDVKSGVFVTINTYPQVIIPLIPSWSGSPSRASYRP